MTGAIGQGVNSIAAGFERLDRAASRLARDADSTDIAANVTDLMRAKQDVRVGVAVLKTTDEMTGTILDLFA